MGKIVGAGKVEVKAADGNTQILTTKNIMIATGSIPVELPFLKFDEKRIVSNTGALSLAQLPKSMIVVGGGAIGLELGSVRQRLGAKVTVIEYANRLGGTTGSGLYERTQEKFRKRRSVIPPFNKSDRL